MKLPTPEIVEVLAAGGLDFVVLDNEHALIGPRDLSAMIAIARGCGIVPFVRVPGHAPRDVQPPLDAGAAGLIVPHVDDADQARDAVAACRFPPLGRRSVSNSGRAGGWGGVGLPDYMEQGNQDVCLIGQLESREAVENADAIASTPGLDGVMIGPADLAVSCGLGLDDPELERMVRGIEETCRRAGHVMGITAPDGAGAASRIARGHRFVVVATDAALLVRSARAVVASAAASR
ncbi:HpcH/HpaI aldolase/citrate lyase family protein [Streptomyces sp. NPDC102360]|uniref:HpcH/HpaI aldolase family protein n=1 Tax=Streptomyces sp. NPDC102360 TaxID=3366160 RepID=UPI00381CFC09